MTDSGHSEASMMLVRQFANGVAHDFNDILTVINGCSELLQAEIPDDHPSRELVDEIRQAGERAQMLTRQLRTFGRAQSVTPELVDLNAVIAGSERTIRRLLGPDIILSTDLATPIWPMQADPAELEQLVLNLAVTARAGMPTGGALMLRSACAELLVGEGEIPAGEFVVLEVADTGPGMDAETRAHLFEPRFTAASSGDGAGLGMATVASIVREAQGHVTVESTLGEGTTFRVYLPRAAGVATTQEPSATRAAMPRGTETVLLVEDDESLRQLVRTMLRGLGYKVLEAANGAAAVTLSRGLKEPIHLLLTDVVMPHLGGRQLADVVLAARPECRVLFLSGYNSEEMIRRGVVDSAATFLQKPFTIGELAERVRAVLGKR
jgi:two-component system cell cycle sensor histidine kinase/response regulator CckA